MKDLSVCWLDRLLAARHRFALSVLLFSGTPTFAEEAGYTGGQVAIRAGKVLTMDAGDTVINNAVVLVKEGSIEHIGSARDTKIPGGYRVIEAQDKWVFPGIIDAHNHTAGSLMDLNDMVYLSNPGLRTLETILPDNELIKGARAGGVTTVLLIPGSGTNMSGFGTVAKTAGKTVDEVVVRSPGSLKIAQAGNPEWYWYGVGRSFMNYNTRQTLEKARAYHEAWEAYEKGTVADSPAFDPIFDEFRGLFRGEFPVSVHTQIYQVLMTTVDMLTTKMKIKTVLDHCTFDAFKVAPLVLKTDAFTINGPSQMSIADTACKSCSLDLQNPIQSEVLFHVVNVAVSNQIETTPRFGQACRRDLPSSPPFRATVALDQFPILIRPGDQYPRRRNTLSIRKAH